MMTRRSALAGLLIASACRKRPKPVPVDAGDAGTDAGSITDAGTDAEAAVDAGPLYRTTSGGFEVRFPDGKPPEVEDKPVTGGLTVRLFKVQFGTSGYIVTFDDFNRTSTRTPQVILDGVKEGVLETTAGTVDHEEPLLLEGHPGLDLTISATTSGIAMRQRVHAYVVDGRLYQLIVVAPTWSGANSREQDFFDSFRLLADAGP